MFDRETGGILERLLLRPELGAFERALRERMERAAAFEDERFAHARSIERDPTSGAVTIVSEFVPGNRLSDLLDGSAVDGLEEASAPGVDVALGFLLEILPALAALHSATGFTHGTVGPGRIVVTPAGEVVLLDWIFAHTLERLKLDRRRLWRELGLAMPTTAGACRFDVCADVAQAALTGVAIVIGRPLRGDEYPDGLTAVVSEVVEIAQIRGSARFATGLQRFLHRALPLPGSRPFPSADEAGAALRQLAREVGVSRCRTALGAFVSEFNRVGDLERAETDAEHETHGFDGISGTGAAALLVADTSAARSVSAALEFEIALDDVVDSGGTARDVNDVDPVPYEVSLLPVLDDDIASLVVNADASETTPLPAADTDTAPTSAIPAEPAPLVASDDPKVEEPVGVEIHTPAPVADIPPVPEPAVPPSSAKSHAPARQRRRGARRDRDKLRSSAQPAPVRAAPAALPAPAPPPAPPPMPYYPPVFDPREFVPSPAAAWTFAASAAIAAPPVALPKPVPKTATVRVKSEPPAGFAPPVRPGGHHESSDLSARPHVDRASTPRLSAVQWKLGAAATLLLAVGAGAVARPYLLDRLQPQTAAAAAPAPLPQKAPPAPAGSLALVTQPAGARVLLDGVPAGETPLTIESVAPGRHTVTFVTAAGSVRKNVRVESGKTASLDVPVYSGWVAVFAPVLLDIAESGRSIGTTEQGRLMLSPGRHQLTFSNRELGYASTQTVDVAPGEERSVNLQPTGELNLNALPWAEVWVDGQKTGDTPIANLRVPLGTHEIVFKHPQFGDRTLTATVRADGPVAAAVDFTKTPPP